MRGLLPPDKQHQAEDRALQDAEEEAEIFETEVLLIMVILRRRLFLFFFCKAVISMHGDLMMRRYRCYDDILPGMSAPRIALMILLL